jgi:hypothetical protein
MLFNGRGEHVRAEGDALPAVLLRIAVAPVTEFMSIPTSTGTAPSPSRSAPCDGIIELKFAGAQLRLRGTVDEDSLCSVLRALRQSSAISY